MIDYQKMYYLLCNAASKAMDATPEEAKQLLQAALYEAESCISAAVRKAARRMQCRRAPNDREKSAFLLERGLFESARWRKLYVLK